MGCAFSFGVFMSSTPATSNPPKNDSPSIALPTGDYPTSIDAFPPAQYRQWQGLKICYQAQDTLAPVNGSANDSSNRPAVILVHGFGASWGHWRKVIPLMAQSCRVYAIDLLGFGGSDKPAPGEPLPYFPVLP